MKIYEDVFTGKYTSHGVVIPLISWLIIVAEMNKIFIDIFRSYDIIKKFTIWLIAYQPNIENILLCFISLDTILVIF